MNKKKKEIKIDREKERTEKNEVLKLRPLFDVYPNRVRQLSLFYFHFPFYFFSIAFALIRLI